MKEESTYSSYIKEKHKLLIRWLWNSVIILPLHWLFKNSVTLTALENQDLQGTLLLLQIHGPCLFPGTLKWKARPGKTNIYFMKVSLTFLLDKDKGEMFLRDSYDIFLYTDLVFFWIFFFFGKTKQNFEKLPGCASKGIQNPVFFKWAEKWFKWTELFTASGFYFVWVMSKQGFYYRQCCSCCYS